MHTFYTMYMDLFLRINYIDSDISIIADRAHLLVINFSIKGTVSVIKSVSSC